LIKNPEFIFDIQRPSKIEGRANKGYNTYAFQGIILCFCKIKIKHIYNIPQIF
jgi:hypothetical protein